NLTRNVVLSLAVTLSVLGCAGPGPAGGAPTGGAGAQSSAPAPAPTGPKRVVAAMQGSPLGGYARLDPNNSERGNQELGGLVHAGLTGVDPTGRILPRLAETVPTVDNGLWKVNPDGTMETT